MNPSANFGVRLRTPQYIKDRRVEFKPYAKRSRFARALTKLSAKGWRNRRKRRDKVDQPEQLAAAQRQAALAAQQLHVKALKPANWRDKLKALVRRFTA